MQYIKLFLLLFITSINFAQNIEIPEEEYPFYSIIEWKGIGGILMQRDPTLSTRKINLTLASTETTLTWKQSFNPKDKDAFYISSENARYVYFLDNLELTADGKYFYSQLNSAGNVKSSSSSLLSTFKKLGGFELSDIELIDIVTTDKALVHIFRHSDSKTKTYTDIAVTMTHHNLINYAVIIGQTPFDVIKDNLASTWNYIGSTGDQIYFAARDNQSKQKGWTVKQFNSKAQFIETRFIPASDHKFQMTTRTSFSNSGAYYLKRKEKETEQGTLTHFDGQFYLSGIQNKDNQLVYTNAQLKDGKWLELNKQILNTFKSGSKESIKIGIYPLNEGLAVHFEDKLNNQVILFPLNANTEIITTKFEENMIFNPSRFVLNGHVGDFAVILQDRNLFFDQSQLMKKGNVIFEVIKK
jgi:hypothetical protein